MTTRKLFALGSVLTSLCTCADTAEPPELEREDGFPVAASFSLALDSKYLSYGFVDNTDPILTPSAEVAFFETLTFGTLAIFDTTTYGRKAGYGNRGGKDTELHAWTALDYSFSPKDYDLLPTTIDVSLSYLYEYHPRAKARHGVRDPGADDDSQFLSLEIGLPDAPLAPCVLIERDFLRDDGTYVNLELGHTFALTDTLSLRPSVAQGFGNASRVKAYADVDKAGLLDTFFKLECCWAIADNVELSGYVGWCDFLFDRRIRRAARDYEATGRCDESWSAVCGVALSVGF